VPIPAGPAGISLAANTATVAVPSAGERVIAQFTAEVKVPSGQRVELRYDIGRGVGIRQGTDTVLFGLRVFARGTPQNDFEANTTFAIIDLRAATLTAGNVNITPNLIASGPGVQILRSCFTLEASTW
jgi:hypothetical protein